MVIISKIFTNFHHSSSLGFIYLCTFLSLDASDDQANDIEMPNASAPEEKGKSQNLLTFFSAYQRL